MGFAGLMRLEAEAKNSSEKERMREVRGAETRSVTVSKGSRQLACTGPSIRESLRDGEEGDLPTQVVPKVLSI